MQIVRLRNESSRGAWVYREWRPVELSRFVEVIWESEGTTTEALDRHFPNGTIELLLNLGGERYELIEPVGTSRFATTWVSGQQVGPTLVAQPRRHAVMGIRLLPAGAYALFGAPLRVVTGLIVELEDLIGPSGRELVDRCREAASVAARFRIAAAWLATRLDRARALDPAIAWAAAQIERHGGDVPIAHLRAETGFSKARFVAAFRDQVGVSPKVYARIVRFRNALALLESGAPSLIDVALTSGYYDQPHMNADFRELAGMSPRELVVARYPSGVPVPLPE